MNESLKSELVKLLYGVAGAILGSTIVVGANLYMNNSAVSATYVGIAAAILKPQEKNVALRSWAVDVIDKKAPSDIKMSDDLKKQLIDGEINLYSAFIRFKDDDDVVKATGIVK